MDSSSEFYMKMASDAEVLVPRLTYVQEYMSLQDVRESGRALRL